MTSRRIVDRKELIVMSCDVTNFLMVSLVLFILSSSKRCFLNCVFLAE